MTWSSSYKTLREIPEEHKQSFLTVPEASRLSTVPYDELRRAISTGGLDVLLTGLKTRRALIRVDRLRAWISANTVRVGATRLPRRPRMRRALALPADPKECRRFLRETAMKAYDDAQAGKTTHKTSRS